MWFTDDGVAQYYSWYKRDKELAHLRKLKKKKAEKRAKKLAIEKRKLANKIAREEKRRLIIEAKRAEKLKKLDEFKELGWKKGYTKSDVLKRSSKKSRDLSVCKEVYLLYKQGLTHRQIGQKFDKPINWVLRYKYEYEHYLKAKLAEEKPLTE